MATNGCSSSLEGAALPTLCLETRLYATFNGASLYVLALVSSSPRSYADITHSVTATRPTKAIFSKCPFIMMTEPILIALFAYINSVLPAPLEGKVINDCEGKKTGDPCETILAPASGLKVKGICIGTVDQS